MMGADVKGLEEIKIRPFFIVIVCLRPIVQRKKNQLLFDSLKCEINVFFASLFTHLCINVFFFCVCLNDFYIKMIHKKFL